MPMGAAHVQCPVYGMDFYMDDLCDFENLYRAHKKCQHGKRWKDSVACYDLRALENTLDLQERIKNCTYKLGRYHKFRLMERGKPREIKATRYVDRVFLQNLTETQLKTHVVPTFISGNGASREGCGTDYMRLRLLKDMRDYYNKHGTDGFVLMGDFHAFFDSISHDYVNERYSCYLQDEQVLDYIKMVNASTPGDRGFPLGNVTSQVTALMAGSELDHYIKERLHIKYYGRYMDDFYLIHEDKGYLHKCMEEIKVCIEKAGLELNQKKTHITTLKHGVNYLGYHFHMSDSGKVVIQIMAKKLIKQRRKLKKLKKKVDSGNFTYEKVKESYIAWRGSHSRTNKDGKKRKFRPDTYYAILQMDIFFLELFSDYTDQNEKQRLEALKKRRRKNCHNH